MTTTQSIAAALHGSEYTIKTITHSHFGTEPVTVYAIKVQEPVHD